MTYGCFENFPLKIQIIILKKYNDSVCETFLKIFSFSVHLGELKTYFTVHHDTFNRTANHPKENKAFGRLLTPAYYGRPDEATP